MLTCSKESVKTLNGTRSLCASLNRAEGEGPSLLGRDLLFFMGISVAKLTTTTKSQIVSQ